MIRAKRIAKSLATLGTLMYAFGAVLLVVSTIPMSKNDLTGALLLVLIGAVLVATGLVQMHEERYHKKTQ